VTLHPWNKEFAWRSPAPPFTTLTDAQAAQFDRDGFVVLENVFDADEIAEVRDEIDGFEAQADAFLQQREDGRLMIAETGAITFSVHLAAKSKRLADLTRHPALLGLCADLVGPDVNLYWDQAVYKKPEKPRRFPWHQDNGYAFVEPQQYLTCWIALTDATEQNGCPQVAAGLHRHGTLRHTYVDPLGYECFSHPDDVRMAAVAAGGVVVFSSLTPHLTGPNTTDAVRKAYIVQYAPTGARIQQGDPDAGPPVGDEAADAPDRQYPVLRGGSPA
jgi:ectoine hydroxylase-related dioxygenase (phytanoyl-CoA dioxygenase family)